METESNAKNWKEQFIEEGRGEPQALITVPERTIWKFQIPVLEDFIVKLPAGAEIIRFDNEGGKLYLWAVVDPNEPNMFHRRLLAFKTGAVMPRIPLKYLGMAAIHIQQELMLYYFEEC